MTDLIYWTALSGVMIALMWVPYILDRILVNGMPATLGNPPVEGAKQSPWGHRCKCAHRVARETFVVFGTLAVLTAIVHPEDTYPATLAQVYFIATLVHYVVYSAGIPVARTLAFAVASLATIGLGLRLIGAI